jgi:hypothetical protein
MDDGRRCIGRKSSGERCKKAAVKGATVCATHGAAAPQVKAKAAVRAELMDWSLNDQKEDPGEVLLRLIAQSSRRVGRLAEELQQKVEEQGLEFAMNSGLARVEAEERDRLGNFATKGIAAGLKEREVRIAERQVDILGGVVAAMLEAMNPTPEQAEAAKIAFKEQLALHVGDAS